MNLLIAEEQGTVYFKRVVAQTTRGNVTADDIIANPAAAQDVSPRGFASDLLEAESVATTTYGTLSYSGTLTGVPLRPYKVRVYATVGSSTYEAKDYSGDGYLVGYDLQGTVNYTTGAVTVEFANNPGDSVVIYADYSTDFEQATDIPKIIMKLVSSPIAARVFALKDKVLSH